MIMSVNEQRMNRTGRAGFTLIELIIVVTIVAILALIAYPSYINSITRSKRAAATACLSSYATFMERFYTTNLRYDVDTAGDDVRSEEHTSELQSLMRISYAVFCLKKKKAATTQHRI